jgi:hypothetical protein
MRAFLYNVISRVTLLTEQVNNYIEYKQRK